MKKVLVVLLMLLICLAYFYSVRTNSPQKKVAAREKEKIQKGLQQVTDELTNNYPKTAEMVVEYHNKIMNYQYSQYMQEELVRPAIEATRMLYTKELLELNAAEFQENALLQEIQSNKQRSLFILQSKIMSTRYNADETAAVVKVIHATNVKDMVREYMVVKEDGYWKISGWSSVEEEE